MQIAKPPIDPTRVHAARNRVRNVIATELGKELRARYQELTPADDEPYARGLGVQWVHADHSRKGFFSAVLCSLWQGPKTTGLRS